MSRGLGLPLPPSALRFARRTVPPPHEWGGQGEADLFGDALDEGFDGFFRVGEVFGFQALIEQLEDVELFVVFHLVPDQRLDGAAHPG
ncbi:MAG: hypothetical protein JWP86_2140, partial [Phenylobacterium sp.]|nr:hypothetical protein [Phenylobacterium sp.]